MNPFLIVCNWKTYLSYNQIKTWLTEHATQLHQLCSEAHKNQIELVFALPAESLMYAQNFSFSLAAQNCSAWGQGAHTGETTAESIAQLGCTYSLIGHSERRLENGETEELISKKYLRAIHAGVQPILCVGESLSERQSSNLEEIVARQLKPAIAAVYEQTIIAYEPIWAIGSGITPSADNIAHVATFIRKALQKEPTHHKTIRVLYGGSVTSQTIPLLLKAEIDGFLIGKASTDFQELKKIVFSILRR